MKKFVNLSKKMDVSTGLFNVLSGRTSSLLKDGTNRQRRHFGIEYEAAKYNDFDDCFDEESALDAIYTLGQHINYCPEDLFEIKSDCSLNGDSFEIATAPMTESVLKVLDWDAMFNYLIENGYKTSDFNRRACNGIHCHVNKRSLSYIKQAGVNAELFMASNYERIRRFARRHRYMFERWSAFHPIYGGDLDDLIYLAHKGDYSPFHECDAYSMGSDDFASVALEDVRYRAVNFMNRNTYEIRIFNATLDASVMEAIVDFNILIWDMVDTPKYEMDMDEFLAEARRRGMYNLVQQLENPYEGPDIDEGLIEVEHYDDDDDYQDW